MLTTSILRKWQRATVAAATVAASRAEWQRATVAAAKMMVDATAKSQMKTIAFRDAAYAAFSGDADRKRRASSDDNIQQEPKKTKIPMRLGSGPRAWAGPAGQQIRDGLPVFLVRLACHAAMLPPPSMVDVVSPSEAS
jgi:hypothetical protein